MLGQGGEEGEAHLTDSTHKRLLLHLHALVLQQVGGLAEDLHTLGALEGAILAHHALVFMRVGQVRDVVAAGSTLVPSFAPYLQGGLLGLDSMLLAVLGLLQGGVLLQNHTIHGAAQRVVGPLRERVHNRRRSHRVLLLLLPRLRHPAASYVTIQSSAEGVDFQSQVGGRMWSEEYPTDSS